MGLVEELKKLARPYDDDDDFYEGADEQYGPSTQADPTSEQLDFEKAFAAAEEAPAQKKPRKPFFVQSSQQPSEPKPQKPSRKQRGGSDSQVLLFSPKSFDEAGELATYLTQGRSLVMTLESVPNEMARRLLDFISGIAFAMNAKITPVSAKTYFITPENVDLLDVQAQAADDDDYDF